MRQMHNRVGRPFVLFSGGNMYCPMDSNITLKQGGISFSLAKLGNNLTGSVSGSSDSANSSFRAGKYRCTTDKIDVTDYNKLHIKATYSFSGTDVYQSYHARRVGVLLLTTKTCFCSATGGYYSNTVASPDETSTLPRIISSNLDKTSQGSFERELNISALTGSYYIAPIILIKATNGTGILNVESLWLD